MTSPLRLHNGVTQARPSIRFTCDGQQVQGIPGESLAASLVAAGIATFRPAGCSSGRGVYCGMGVCRECLVTIDGEPDIRACMSATAAGMTVQTRPGAFAPVTAGHADTEAEPETPDVLVIGGGPAGMSAALAAAQAGARCVLLDERGSLGGQYYKQLAPGHTFVGKPDRQFAAGAQLVERVTHAGVDVRTGTTVWGAFPGPEIAAVSAGRQVRFRPRKLVLATGAYERGVPFPGWTLPGCMTTGAGQTLARSNRVAPGSRVVIAGHGPLNFQLAAELRAAGVQVVAVAEASAVRGMVAAARMAITDGRNTLAGLRMLHALRDILQVSTIVTEASGAAALEEVVLASVDHAGSPVAGTEHTLRATALCIGYGFQPSNELALLLGCAHAWDARAGARRAMRDEDGRSSLPDVFIAGDAAGMGGAAAAMAEGTLAGTAAAYDLGPGSAQASIAARRALARHRRFQAALWTLFDAPPVFAQLARPDTLVCRCEEVTHAQVARHIAGGESLDAIRKETRAGMGRCQGRYCGPVLAALCGGGSANGFSARAPARPIPIWQLARENDQEHV